MLKFPRQYLGAGSIFTIYNPIRHSPIVLVNMPCMINGYLKKTMLIHAFLLLIASQGYGQRKYYQIDTVKGRGGAIDTILRRKTELSFNKAFHNIYKKDESIVQALMPYFVSDIVTPTNTTHALYFERLKEARELLPKAKSEFINLVRERSSIKRILANSGVINESDVNSINFVFVPVYYITPNVVSYKDSENISKYYTLGKGPIKYLMLRNNQPIGYFDILNQNDGLQCYFLRIRPNESEGYKQIVKLGRHPIGLKQGIMIDPNNQGGGSIDTYGYVDQGHLVLYYYEEGVVQQVGTDGYVAPNPRFWKTHTLETAESFFSSGSGSKPILNYWLEDTVSRIKNRAQKQ